jgi:hypothetical protein
VNSELTLNLGLRYEFYGVNSEVNDRYRVFDLYACQRLLPSRHALVLPGQEQLRSAHRHRLGAQGLGGKTIIRTGAGIYHGPGQIDDQNAALDNMSDKVTRSRRSRLLACPTRSRRSWALPRMLASRRARSSATAATCTAPNGASPSSSSCPQPSWARFGYVGSSASMVTTRKYINNLDVVTKVRPLPTFGRMDEKNNDGNSNFNALQLSLHRGRPRPDLGHRVYVVALHQRQQHRRRRRVPAPDRSPAAPATAATARTDVRHTITSNWVYQLPFGPGQRFLTAGFASRSSAAGR